MLNSVNVQLPDDISTLLESQKGHKIMIKLRNGNVITGILRDFDIHMTMKLDSASQTSEDGKTHDEIGSMLLRGDNILLVSILDSDDDA